VHLSTEESLSPDPSFTEVAGNLSDGVTVVELQPQRWQSGSTENMHDANSVKVTHPNAYLPSPSPPILFHTSVLDKLAELKK